MTTGQAPAFPTPFAPPCPLPVPATSTSVSPAPGAPARSTSVLSPSMPPCTWPGIDQGLPDGDRALRGHCQGYHFGL